MVIASTLLMVGSTATGITTVKADRMGDAKSAISQQKQHNSTLMAQLSAQENKVAKLNDAVANKQVAITHNQQDIKTTQQTLDQLANKVQSTKKDLAARKAVLRQQLISLQRESNDGATSNIYLNFILDSRNFSDLVSRAMTLSKISSANKRALDVVNQLKEQLLDLQTDQQAKKTHLVAVQAQLVQAKKGLEADKKSAQQQQQLLAKKLKDNKGVLAGLQAKLTQVQAELQAQALAATKAQARAKAQAAQAKTMSAVAKATSVTNVTSSSTGTTTTTTNLTASAQPSANGGSLITNMAKFIGVPYVWGGTSPSGFDCSGLVQYAARMSGISLPRTSQQQSTVGTYESVSSAQPGDLLFWGGVGSAYHVAVYIGNGMFIHAPQPGENVKVGSIAYFTPSFARRI